MQVDSDKNKYYMSDKKYEPSLWEWAVETGTSVGRAENAGVFIIKGRKRVTKCYCQGCPNTSPVTVLKYRSPSPPGKSFTEVFCQKNGEIHNISKSEEQFNKLNMNIL